MVSSNQLICLLLIGTCSQLIFSSANQYLSRGNYVVRANGDDELVFAQIVYRHGNRTPITSYPSDPYFNLKYFPEGFGNLTDTGKELHFNLGKYFRARYKSLLGDNFPPDKLYVRSTGENRALESAKFNTAGLLSPSRNQTWKEFEKKKVIPIHTVPFDEENLLYPSVVCAKAEKQQEEFLAPDEIQQLLQKYSKLRKYMQENSGLQVNNLLDCILLYDALSIEHDRGLNLPYWAQNVLETSNDVLVYLKGVLMESYSPTTVARKVRSGFLLKEILDRFKNKTLGISNPEQVIHVYSGHDLTIANCLIGLNVFDYEDVSFGASLLFELHRSKGEYYVQVFYKNSNAEHVPVIMIPNCGTKCPLNKMYELYADVLPKENETAETLCRL